MPAYLFTFHSYRSWNADNPRGFVQAGRGIQPPNSALARYYDRKAQHQAFEFNHATQPTILWITWDACNHRDWRLHAVALELSHVHILVSWKSSEDWRAVRKKLKKLISWALSRDSGIEGRRWLVRGASRKHVTDRRHFDYLVNTYLPRHRGLFWQEGHPAPAAPTWAEEVSPISKPPSSDGG